MFLTFFIHISIRSSHNCPDLWFQIKFEPVREVSFWIRISACYWNSDNPLSLFKLILDCEMELPQHRQKCSDFKEESLKHSTPKPHSGLLMWRLLLTLFSSQFIRWASSKGHKHLWFKKVFTKKKYLKKIQIHCTVLVSKCHICTGTAVNPVHFHRRATEKKGNGKCCPYKKKRQNRKGWIQMPWTIPTPFVSSEEEQPQHQIFRLIKPSTQTGEQRRDLQFQLKLQSYRI